MSTSYSDYEVKMSEGTNGAETEQSRTICLILRIIFQEAGLAWDSDEQFVLRKKHAG